MRNETIREAVVDCQTRVFLLVVSLNYTHRYTYEINNFETTGLLENNEHSILIIALSQGAGLPRLEEDYL